MVICCQEIHSPVWKNHPRNQTGSILVLIVHLTQETTEPAWSRWARLLGVTTLPPEALQQRRKGLPRSGHGLGL